MPSTNDMISKLAQLVFQRYSARIGLDRTYIDYLACVMDEMELVPFHP